MTRPGCLQTGDCRQRCNRACVGLSLLGGKVAGPSPDAALAPQVRVGELLLRHEREETDAISHLAQELLEKEYRTPTRELRCSSERAACLQCYTDSAAGPLACTSQVEAFAKCADAALRVCVA